MNEVVVVIPCYNAAAFLAEALDSVLAQARQVSRVLVVDDWSTDNTSAIAEGYGSRGHPVECLRTVANGGPSRARNLGIQHATEPFVAFLDADDVWKPNHCAEVAGLLDAHPHAVLAFGGIRSFPQASAPPTTVVLPSSVPVEAFWTLLTDNPVVQSAAVARRDALLRAGGYQEEMRYAEDYDLWLRMAAQGPFVATDRVTCLKRQHEEQATRQASRMIEGAWAARVRARHRLVALGADIETLARLDSILAASFEREIAAAWHSRDRSLVSALLDIGARTGVQSLVPVHQKAKLRLRLYWPVWRVAAAVWDAAPEGVRRRVRGGRKAGADA